MNLFETWSEITKVESDLTTQMERSNFFGGDLTGGDMTMERSNRIPLWEQTGAIWSVGG